MLRSINYLLIIDSLFILDHPKQSYWIFTDFKVIYLQNNFLPFYKRAKCRVNYYVIRINVSKCERYAWDHLSSAVPFDHLWHLESINSLAYIIHFESRFCCSGLTAHWPCVPCLTSASAIVIRWSYQSIQAPEVDRPGLPADPIIVFGWYTRSSASTVTWDRSRRNRIRRWAVGERIE